MSVYLGRNDGVNAYQIYEAPQEIYEIPKEKDFNKGDVLTDEEYKEFEQLQKQVDVVETDTTKVLIHLHTLADGINRDDIEVAATLLATKKNDNRFSDNSLPFESDYYDDFVYERRFNPFRRDSNFDDQDHSNRPAHTIEGIKKVISGLATILFGVGIGEPKGDLLDHRHPEEMEAALKIDINTWNNDLSHHYNTFYGQNMHEAFCRAEFLINARKVYAKAVFYQRVTLYATAILAAVGMIIGKKALAYVSLTASVATFLYMVTDYGSNSFKQANLAAGLKASTEYLERHGSTNRITLSIPPAFVAQKQV